MANLKKKASIPAGASFHLGRVFLARGAGAVAALLVGSRLAELASPANPHRGLNSGGIDNKEATISHRLVRMSAELTVMLHANKVSLGGPARRVSG